MQLSTINEILRDPRLKVKQAKRHIDKLIREASVIPEELYVISNGPTYSFFPLAQPDCYQLTFVPKEPIQEYYQGIIGDVINNLREALDFFMTRIMRACDDNGKVHFPFSKEKQQLTGHPSWSKIMEVAPYTAHFIENSVRPCEDANIDLWKLNKLWNLNKHNDFVPSLASATTIFDSISINGNLFGGAKFGFNANRKGNIIQSNSPITMEGNVSVSCKITFTEGSYFSEEPVVRTLLNVHNVVLQTLDALEEFLKETNNL